ncbi:unnamed protein product, partial [Hapterophycus canaliculatus]
QRGRWQEAVGLLKEMPMAGVTPNLISFSSVVAACEEGGQLEAAAGLRREMMRAQEAAPGCNEDFNVALGVFAEGGRWKEAVGLLREMLAETSGVSPDVDSFNSAIEACGNGGQWGEAVDLLIEMRALGIAPNASTYLAAMCACESCTEHAQ